MSTAAALPPTTFADWEAAYGLSPQRDVPFTTLSGETVRPLYTAAEAKPQNQWDIHPLVDGCTHSGAPAVFQ